MIVDFKVLHLQGLPVPIWSLQSFQPAPSATSLHSCGVSPFWTVEAWAKEGGCKVEVRVVVVVEVPGALWGQIVSAGGREADFGIACCGDEIGVGGVTAAGDAMVAIAGGWFGWRTGPCATAEAALEAGKWKA